MYRKMEQHYQVTQLDEGFWRLQDADVYMDLMVGRHHALLFDTGYGGGDLKSVIASVTEKPLYVVCSHGHLDHACGNGQFSEVFLHWADVPLCLQHNSMAGTDPGKLRPVVEGDRFDLGGITLETVELPGHTRGSIGLLCPERELLFVGDAINGFVWLFLPEATDLNTYAGTLRKAERLPFARMVLSHEAKPVDKAKLSDYLDLAEHLDFETGTPVKPPVEVSDEVRICSRGGIHYDNRVNPNHAAIMISREKLPI